MKGSLYLMKRAYSSVALMMVAVSAMAAQGGADSPSSASLSPYREPSGYAPEPGYDPCLLSPAFSGCIGTRETLKVSQEALAAEQTIVGQFRALMEIKNEQSRRYIAALDDLNAVRERLVECNVTNRTAGNALSGAVNSYDPNSSPAETSRLAGDVRQVPEILLNDRIAYPDYVSQIRALRAENASLRLSLTAKDDQLATSQKEAERLVAGNAELEARAKERDVLSREDARQQGPLPASADAGLPSGDYASGVAFSQEVLRAIDTNSALGILTDKKALTAGFSDNMSGAVKYSTSALLAAMSEKQKEVAGAREKTLAQQVQQGNTAVMRFQASPGVVKTSQGFLYRIERPGDAPLKKNVPLRLVVKESLADGTSLLDMTADGSELRQNVDDMPQFLKRLLISWLLTALRPLWFRPNSLTGRRGSRPGYRPAPP